MRDNLNYQPPKKSLNYDDGDVFSTADMKLACTLWALDYRVLENGIYRDSEGILYCTFDRKEVQDVVSMWNEGRPIIVDIHKIWYAYYIFRSALYKRHDGTSKDRMTVVSLMTMGNQVDVGGVWRDNNMIVYDFQDDQSKKDAQSFLEIRPIEVCASDFWRANDQFKSNIRNV